MRGKSGRNGSRRTRSPERFVRRRPLRYRRLSPRDTRQRSGGGSTEPCATADDVIVCEWNDLDQVAAALASGEVACVLMEAVMCNTGLVAPAPGYLDRVKQWCARHGALLVVDEVITVFDWEQSVRAIWAAQAGESGSAAAQFGEWTEGRPDREVRSVALA